MRAFAALLDRLVLTPQRNVKLRLMTDYFRQTPDPDRGFALAALTGDLVIPSVKPAMLRALVVSRVDEVLFGYSYDFVGDLAETIALIWPTPNDATVPLVDAGPRESDGGIFAGVAPADHPFTRPFQGNGVPRPAVADLAIAHAAGATTEDPADLGLGAMVGRLQRASRLEGPRLVEDWLDRLYATGRWGLIKLVAGGLRVGVSARLAKQAVADLGDREVNEIEELWHGLVPPYADLFAWLEGRAAKPVAAAAAAFRPVMLSHAIADGELAAIRPEDYAAEWKWDGIRVQAVAEGGVRRLYSRTGEEISGAFPDLVDAIDIDGAIDGELLIGGRTVHGFALGSFGDLQQRLNRKSVTARVMETFPAFIRAYDLLADGTEDLRTLPFRERRVRLEAAVARSRSGRLDLSPLVAFADGAELAARRAEPPEPVIEGLMLKRWDSPYVPGRPKGPWFKWKRDPHVIDAVLMYAQRGHGKRSSFYSDYTFGVWQDGPSGNELVPVGKAYFGFTDEELVEIDRFVRNNTVSRFGPVREVRHEPGFGLVLEVAFEGLNRSTRHRSGVAMRFPRIARLRWDKPPAEADRLETLAALLRE